MYIMKREKQVCLNEILIDTEFARKKIGGLEVQNELILTEVGPLATMDPIQRGSVTIPLPQKQIEADTSSRRPAYMDVRSYGAA